MKVVESNIADLVRVKTKVEYFDELDSYKIKYFVPGLSGKAPDWYEFIDEEVLDFGKLMAIQELIPLGIHGTIISHGKINDHVTVNWAKVLFQPLEYSVPELGKPYNFAGGVYWVSGDDLVLVSDEVTT